MAGTTTRRVWYKRCRFGDGGRNLQALLTAALDAQAGVSDRLWSPLGDAERTAVNAYHSRYSMLFGQFFRFERGFKQPLINIEDGKKAYDLEVRAPDASDGKQREFLESLAYFGVFANHVVFVQSKALRAGDFEKYLRWLLAECAKTIPDDEFIVLSDQVPDDSRRRVATGRITAVTIGQPLAAVPVAEVQEDGEAHVRYETSGSVFESIKQFLDPKIFDKLKLTDSLEADNIEVQLTVRVHGKRHLSDDGRNFLEAVSNATRNFDPEDFSLQLASGRLKGEELKLFKPLTVKTTEDGGLMDEGSLFEQMAYWLKSLIDDDMVDE